MKILIGLLLIASGVVAGFYFGIWWAFIGGIIEVIEQVRAPHLEASKVAFGIARIIFAGAIGTLSATVLIIPGFAFISSDKPKYRKRS